mgnify:CR=1 FL=1
MLSPYLCPPICHFSHVFFWLILNTIWCMFLIKSLETHGGVIMSAKVQTSLRLEADKLAQAKRILDDLGLNFSEAVNIFANQIILKQGLPFMVTLPNHATRKAMQEVRQGKNLAAASLEQLKEEIGAQ